jgi:hypothetical protein
MSYRETEHLRVLIANERRDRLARVAPAVANLGHEVIAREIDVADVGVVTARERPDVALVGLGKSSEHALALIDQIVQEAACPAAVRSRSSALAHRAATACRERSGTATPGGPPWANRAQLIRYVLERGICRAVAVSCYGCLRVVAHRRFLVFGCSRASRHALPDLRFSPIERKRPIAGTSCRRQDSNLRHADYDSAALTS